MEANPAPSDHRPWYLPAASGKSLHLEERVPGCDGEVRGREEEGGRRRRKEDMINGSLFVS